MELYALLILLINTLMYLHGFGYYSRPYVVVKEGDLRMCDDK